ncbi:helix-turn-helix domain-containing protein [Streptomyces virginiae]|uniref:helix-turn-helix domain-containing protein n=1 Tax=Streptomyces virginiae TaxID=1961 RepID=UPI0035D8CD4F
MDQSPESGTPEYQGIRALQDLLGDGWTLTERRGQYSEGYGTFYTLEPTGDPSAAAHLYLEQVRSVTPREVETVLAPQAHLLRHLVVDTTMVVIAPWLSTKTQYMLRENGIGYVDLTGNIGLRISRPAVFIHTVGALRSPQPLSRNKAKATLAGPKAGRLIRLLADVRPPYRASQLAEVASLSLPYVSRLLDTLEEQLLIRRSGRVIKTVDWPGLLRARAAETSLLRPDSYHGMVAPNGIESVLRRLPELPAHEWDGLAVTGPVAARRFAPLAVGGQLMLYVASHLAIDEDLEDALGLLPTSEHADVILLRPSDDVVFERLRQVDAHQEVAVTQLVLDCLSGPGRMPAEGEAVIKEMSLQEGAWRASDISDLRPTSLL